ncbi:MAG: hypothetical protein Q8Q04_01615 [archaeon]|nr:hypothetical protein [archaeon]
MVKNEKINEINGKLFLSHTVYTPEKNSNETHLERMISIFKNGIEPGHESPASSHFHWKYRNQKNFTFYSLGNKIYHAWSNGRWPNDLSTIFIKDSFIKENPERFLNGSYKSLNGDFITSQRDSIGDNLLKNTSYFDKFLGDYNVKDLFHTDIRRLVNQIVSPSVIPPESFGQTFFYNKEFMENLSEYFPKNMEVYFAPEGLTKEEKIVRFI